MLYTAGIIGSSFLINSDIYEQLSENGVALIYALGQDLAGFGEFDVTILIVFNKTFCSQKSDTSADGRL